MIMIKPTAGGGVDAIVASALRAQQARMRVIAENMANSGSTGATPGADPYRGQLPVFTVLKLGEDRGVRLKTVKPDRSPFPKVYDPGHPAADASGYLKRPNVDGLVQALDMKEAQRAYEANLNVMENMHAMEKAALSILDKKA